jgi:hypothetical protein
MTAISADQPVEQHLVRVHRALEAEFGRAVPDRIIEGVVHEAAERLVHRPNGTGAGAGVGVEEEQLLLHTCRISLQARVDAARS